MSVDAEQMLLQQNFAAAELASAGITAGVGSPGYTGEANAQREAAFARSQMPGQDSSIPIQVATYLPWVFAGYAAGGALAATVDIPGGALSAEAALAGVGASVPGSPGRPPTAGPLPVPVVPASPTVPFEGGSAVGIPPPAILPYQSGSSDPTTALLQGGISRTWWAPGDAEAAAYRKKLDAAAREIARHTGLTKPKRKKKPLTVEKLGSNLVQRVVKGMFKPGVARGIAGTAARVGARVLGPLGIGITAAEFTPAGTLPAIGRAILEAGNWLVMPTKANLPGRAKNPADALQPITVTAKVKRDARGVYQKFPFGGVSMVPMPVFVPRPAPAPANRFGLNPKTLANVQKIGGLLDKLKAAKKSKAPAAAAVAALTPVQPALLSSMAPSSTTFFSSRTVAPTRQQKCDCKPKKRGPQRKCLQRVAVVFKSGPRKGQQAGTKCVRYAR